MLHTMKKILPNDRFGRLTVKHRSGQYFVCDCDCGNVTTVYGSNLRKGVTTSCGCYRLQRQIEANTTHGLSLHPLYRTWIRMMGRCYDRNDDRFASYGGRGIVVCDRWLSLELFIADNEGKKQKGLTLDRKNNDGPYSPENCHWTDASSQQRNRRTNRYLTYNGETMLLIDWAARLNMPQHSISTRIKRGWSIEKTLSTPVIPHKDRRRGV